MGANTLVVIEFGFSWISEINAFPLLSAFTCAVSSAFHGFPNLVWLVDTIVDFQGTTQVALQGILLCIPTAWYNAVFWDLSHLHNYGSSSLDCEFLKATDSYLCLFPWDLVVSDTCTHVWMNENEWTVITPLQLEYKYIRKWSWIVGWGGGIGRCDQILEFKCKFSNLFFRLRGQWMSLNKTASPSELWFRVNSFIRKIKMTIGLYILWPCGSSHLDWRFCQIILEIVVTLLHLHGLFA